MSSSDINREILKNRSRHLNSQSIDEDRGPVIYWMERDQRIQDNWALIAASKIAEKFNKELVIFFNYDTQFYGSELRRFDFMINGLKELENESEELNIPFIFRCGNSENELLKIIKELNPIYLVTDHNPIKQIKKAKSAISKRVNVPFLEIDAHNIVPVWITSNKEEYGARTIRGKINSLLENYLTDFPKIEPRKIGKLRFYKNEFENIGNTLVLDSKVEPIIWLRSGSESAFEMLQNFIDHKLNSYGDERNDPNKKVLSHLSVYLHYGQISAQRVALIMQALGDDPNVKVFLEEMIIRKELSDNYIFYNEEYDNFKGFPNWAQASLNAHRDDEREYLYSRSEFEDHLTHDQLWNAAQKELIIFGKMHGYMRMYWAKKILEWSRSPEDAQETAIYLNDKYSLDGRDPNGYTGIAWSIGGVHDRAWFERDVYGKVRYMNYNGAKRKFDVQKYITELNN